MFGYIINITYSWQHSADAWHSTATGTVRHITSIICVSTQCTIMLPALALHTCELNYSKSQI